MTRTTMPGSSDVDGLVDGEATAIGLAELELLWDRHRALWSGTGPFVTPAWLGAWWECFSTGQELLLLRVDSGGMVLGLAPLMVCRGKARLIGSSDLCDHLDFPIRPGYRGPFFRTLLGTLARHGIGELHIAAVRADSAVMQELLPIARSCGYGVVSRGRGVAVHMDLPSSWDAYLKSLDKKQRHEIRRKLRRLSEAGMLQCQTIREPGQVDGAMATFCALFRHSRRDKEHFMSPSRERFFTGLGVRLAEAGMLRLFQVDIDDRPAASVFCLDFDSTTYLYNNGYDPSYPSLSLGLASKALTIKASIEAGCRRYDFLNGDERYKYRLGGREAQLFQCAITLDPL